VVRGKNEGCEEEEVPVKKKRKKDDRGEKIMREGNKNKGKGKEKIREKDRRKTEGGTLHFSAV